MSGVDLTSTKWRSKEEMWEWKELVDPIIYGIGFGLCVIAQILFYIFPRLRVFPRSILSWVNLYNMWYMLSLTIKWAPGTDLHEQWVRKLTTHSPYCKATVLLDTFSVLGCYCCTFLLCFTMFLRVVLRVDIEGKRIYFWIYLAFATLFPFIISCVVAFTMGSIIGFGVCILAGPYAALARIIALGLFSLQCLCFFITMAHIKRAFSVVNTQTQSNFPMSYLVIRFSAVFLSQLIGLMPTQLAFQMQRPEILSNAIFNRFCTVMRFVNTAVEAFVLIFGNVDFMDWLKNQYHIKVLKSKPIPPEVPDIEMSKRGPQLDDSSYSSNEEAMEKTHLSTSSGRMGISTPKHLSFSAASSSLASPETSDVSGTFTGSGTESQSS